MTIPQGTMFPRAIYAGVFDPLTMGHWSIIRTGVYLFDQLVIGIAANPTKTPMFSAPERRDIIQESIRQEEDKVCLVKSDLRRWQNIKLEIFENEFLVEYAKKHDIKYILRGLRDSEDFRQEQTYHFFNKKWAPEIETIYLMPDPEFAQVSSSTVKGMVGFDGWQQKIKPFLTEPAYHRLIERASK